MEALRFLAFLVNPRSRSQWFSVPSCLSFVLVSVCSLFFALSSLPSWFGLSLFVQTRAIATLWGTGQKREFLIDFRTFYASPLIMVASCQKYEIQKTLYFWDCTLSYGWKRPHRNPKRMEQEKATHLVTTWWKRHWNGSIALPCLSCQPPFRSQWLSVPSFLSVCPLFWSLFALCSLLCPLFLLGSVCLCLWKPVRSRHYEAQIKNANSWSSDFRTFCASPLIMVASCQKYEIQKTLDFWDRTPSYGWKHPQRNPKRMEQEKVKHLVTTWWKRHWNGSIALPCFSCQPPFRSQWFSVPSCLSFVLVSVCSLFFALSSLPSWFCLSLFVKTRALATLWGTGQKREFLILRFSHILRFAPYNGGFMPSMKFKKLCTFGIAHRAMGGSTHIATQNGWNRKKRSIWWQLGGNGIGMEALRILAFLVNPRSAPNGFPFLPVCPLFRSLFALCSLLCLLFLLGSVCLYLWKPVRSRHYGAQIKNANSWSSDFRTFCPSPLIMVASCQKYEIQKTLYFWDRTPSYGWKHPQRNLKRMEQEKVKHLVTTWWKRHWNGSIALPCFSCQPPFPLPMVFRSFLSVLCFGLCLLSVLCFVFSSFLVLSVFVCENPCARDTMGHRSKTRILGKSTQCPCVASAAHFLKGHCGTPCSRPILNRTGPWSLPSNSALPVMPATTVRRTKRMEQEKAKHLVTTWWKRHWNGSIAHPCFSCQPPFRSQWFSVPFSLSVLCFGLCLLPVLCFVFSSFLVRSVFICENPCARDTMGAQIKNANSWSSDFRTFCASPLIMVASC